MAVISISYSGGELIEDRGLEDIKTPVIYEHVRLACSGVEKLFNSGNFVKDWFDAKKWYVDEHNEDEFLAASSSVDHFIMDGAKFESAYLIIKDGIPSLSYSYKEDGWEFFVEKGKQLTWKELVEYCKTK